MSPVRTVAPARAAACRHVAPLSARTRAATQPAPVLDRLFNVSMTFQRDSDIVFSYGGVEPLPARPHASAVRAVARAHARQASAWFRSKTRTAAAWTVSHCYTASRREEYAAQLRRHIGVDVYGKCGGLKSKIMGVGHARHSALLQRDYKFYLAFENRLCRDYITEKARAHGHGHARPRRRIGR